MWNPNLHQNYIVYMCTLMTTITSKEKIIKLPQIEFNKVQKKQTKNTSAFLMQDWSRTI